MRIYLDPNPGKRPDRADGGIRRVLDAQIKYLPDFGIHVTNKIDKADLTAGHVDHVAIAEGKPFVSHCHGLMWSEYFDGDTDREVNVNVVNALAQADAITAPSRWVAHAITRGMLRTPQVIYHGVDIDAWEPDATPGNYVLWNKARADAVSDPRDVMRLAAKMPGVKFISTLGAPSKNATICGVVPYEKHKAMITGASVYLATARETFGIGTLEAMASGVPVAGWNYGGQSEIVVNGETGYLAPFGDYDALAECVNKCFGERARLSVNARADVAKRWQWRDKIEQYANLYKSLVSEWTQPRPRVSVVVPCHNLARYLPDALNSLLRQTMQDWECIIVDDASTDDTKQIAETFAIVDARIQYAKTPENLKLSRALNFGHAQTRGRYVMNLDADNVLPERALEILAGALDKRRDIHIAYGALDTMSDDGTNRKRNEFPYPVFSWHEQLAHLNQLHSSAMMRRSVIEQSAGYRERQWRAEDAELWARVTSFGFRAERVTDEPTLVYRWRTGSKSAIESQQNQDRDGNWCEYFPWATARSGDDGRKVIQSNPRAVANVHLVPFGAQGKRADKLFWDVSHHQDPLISVIIPVGPGHTRYLNDALDSLIGQTMREWEAVVINDTGDDWVAVPGAPYARVIKTTGKLGAGAARNIGIQHARGALVFFLDADDMLEPNALAFMLGRYARGDVGYVYSDALVPESPTRNKIYTAPEYNQRGWQHNGLHTQAILMATDDARRIGFDERMPAWEDWDFVVRCAVNGVCGVRVGEPLLLYRKHLGKRSEVGIAHKPELQKILHERYDDYVKGAKQMAGCGGCGSKKALSAIMRSNVARVQVETLDKPLAAGFVRIKYTGGKIAPVTFYANGHPYQAANTPKWKFLDVPAQDADTLLGMAMFERVRVSPKPVVQVAPVEQTPVPVAPIERIPEPIDQAVSSTKILEKETVVTPVTESQKQNSPATPAVPIHGKRAYKPRGKK